MKDIFKRLVVLLLEKEAILVLRKYKPGIVAITGTVGKTSTKDAVHAALSRFVYARKSPKSFNSEIGIPLTILGAKNPTTSTSVIGWLRVLMRGLDLVLLPNHYPAWLVLEVGADKPGDIANAVRIVKPDVVIVTKLSKVPVHVEAFPSPEALFAEKGNLVTALKRGGTLILNADDEDVLAYKNLSDEKTILFGNGNGSNIRTEDYDILYDEHGLPLGISFAAKTVTHEHEADELRLPVTIFGTLGFHHTYHVLAALATCMVLDKDLAVAVKAFNRIDPTPGRMRLIEGIKGTCIIDDSYNSSPVALEEALKTLAMIHKKRGKKKIAVLGDMLELGKFSVDAHRNIGKSVKGTADTLITVGIRARAFAEGAMDAGVKETHILECDDAREAGLALQEMLKPGDIVLVKGSQGVRMERVVEEVMAHPEDKEKLLVRQDLEWQLRG
jgi:UDP-N-acetylmuramoyl-tripeptide--D-alanyl-D-alanine ligase